MADNGDGPLSSEEDVVSEPGRNSRDETTQHTVESNASPANSPHGVLEQGVEPSEHVQSSNQQASEIDANTPGPSRNGTPNRSRAQSLALSEYTQTSSSSSAYDIPIFVPIRRPFVPIAPAPPGYRDQDNGRGGANFGLAEEVPRPYAAQRNGNQFGNQQTSWSSSQHFEHHRSDYERQNLSGNENQQEELHEDRQEDRQEGENENQHRNGSGQSQDISTDSLPHPLRNNRHQNARTSTGEGSEANPNSESRSPGSSS